MDNNAESGSSDNPKTSSNMDTSMYMMTDIKIFIKLLQLVGQCPECSNAITTTVYFSRKKGLAHTIVTPTIGVTMPILEYTLYHSVR